jgi:hypothetical protein
LQLLYTNGQLCVAFPNPFRIQQAGGPDVALDVWLTQSQEAFLAMLRPVAFTISTTPASHATGSTILLLLRNQDAQSSVWATREGVIPCRPTRERGMPLSPQVTISPDSTPTPTLLEVTPFSEQPQTTRILQRFSVSRKGAKTQSTVFLCVFAPLRETLTPNDSRTLGDLPRQNAQLQNSRFGPQSRMHRPIEIITSLTRLQIPVPTTISPTSHTPTSG